MIKIKNGLACFNCLNRWERGLIFIYMCYVYSFIFLFIHLFRKNKKNHLH